MKTEYILQAAEKYKVEGDYCEFCHSVDGEQRYLIEGVTICEPCLLEDYWEDFEDVYIFAHWLELADEIYGDTEGDAIDRAYDEKTN